MGILIDLKRAIIIKPPPPPPPGGDGKQLPVEYISQRPRNNWCWAACCVMVGKQIQIPDVSMCLLATSMHGHDCCREPGGNECDRGAWPSDAYRLMHVTHNADTPSPPQFSKRRLSPLELQAQIDASLPVEVQYRWQDGFAHVALVVGYYPDRTWLVFDPLFGVKTSVSYEYICTGRGGGGEWEGTYFGFAKAAV